MFFISSPSHTKTSRFVPIIPSTETQDIRSGWGKREFLPETRYLTPIEFAYQIEPHCLPFLLGFLEIDEDGAIVIGIFLDQAVHTMARHVPSEVRRVLVGQLNFSRIVRIEAEEPGIPLKIRVPMLEVPPCDLSNRETGQ